MESIDTQIGAKLIGAKLTNITHESKRLHVLTFSTANHQNYRVKFEGFPFETKRSPLNQIVSEARISVVLGFKSVSELRAKGLNPIKYKQLFIKMKDTTGSLKMEIIAAFKPETIKLEKISQ